jgi:hypothetical protein
MEAASSVDSYTDHIATRRVHGVRKAGAVLAGKRGLQLRHVVDAVGPTLGLQLTARGWDGKNK